MEKLKILSSEAIFAFPNLRYSSIYEDSLRYFYSDLDFIIIHNKNVTFDHLKYFYEEVPPYQYTILYDERIPIEYIVERIIMGDEIAKDVLPFRMMSDEFWNSYENSE